MPARDHYFKVSFWLRLRQACPPLIINQSILVPLELMVLLHITYRHNLDGPVDRDTCRGFLFIIQRDEIHLWHMSSLRATEPHSWPKTISSNEFYL
nr:hypothetical protein CFP56_28940 [Quercus suber]